MNESYTFCCSIISRVSCQKGPTRHDYAWQIGPFWQDTLDKSSLQMINQQSYGGDRLNIKMPSYQYRDSHVKDKAVSPTVLSLTWESPYLGKMVFISRRGPDFPVVDMVLRRPKSCVYFLLFMLGCIFLKGSYQVSVISFQYLLKLSTEIIWYNAGKYIRVAAELIVTYTSYSMERHDMGH